MNCLDKYIEIIPENLEFFSMSSFTVCLPGGGAAGASQAGLLCALWEVYGNHIDAISGASVGALNAAIMAKYNDVDILKDLWTGLTRRSVYYMLPTFNFFRLTSALNPRPLYRMIDEHAEDDYDLDELYTKLFIQITRYRDGKCIIKNDISPNTLRATCAIPAAFPPVQVDGEWCVDGGVSNNSPVRPLSRYMRQLSAPRYLFILHANPKKEIPEPSRQPRLLKQIIDFGSLLFNANQENDIENIEYYNKLIENGEEESDKVYINLIHIYPPDEIGTLDFDTDKLQEAFNISYKYIKRWLK